MAHHHLLCCVLYILLCSSTTFAYEGTALDTYVNKIDDVYGYQLLETNTTSSYTLFILNMTSQRWQTPAFSDHPIWHHILWICKPNEVLNTTHGFLYINSGSDLNPTNAGDSLNDAFLIFCSSASTVTAMLFDIPNQPITFYDPPSAPLTEDDVIAYTFRKFLNESGADPTKIAQFAMAKACVRALDTVQSFTSSQLQLATFTVAGASKRGWATWLTAAADPRVIVIVPAIIPLLNTKAAILNEWPSLGEFGWALNPYTNNHVWDYAGTPQFDLLMQNVDPLSYNDRFKTIKKLVIASTFDQFFLLDSPKYFWDQLTEPKWLFDIQNCDHGFSIPGSSNLYLEELSNFHSLAAQNIALPTISWNKVLSNSSNSPPSITVIANMVSKINSVTVWQVNSTRPGYRDFRLNPCSNTATCYSYVTNGVEYTSTNLNPVSVVGDSATFEAIITELPLIASNIQDQHWLGFFVEVVYNIPLVVGGDVLFATTSEPVIFPDTYPFLAFTPNYSAIGYSVFNQTSSASVITMHACCATAISFIILALCS